MVERLVRNEKARGSNPLTSRSAARRLEVLPGMKNAVRARSTDRAKRDQSPYLQIRRQAARNPAGKVEPGPLLRDSDAP